VAQPRVQAPCRTSTDGAPSQSCTSAP
jgi:hypothetical protein